MYDIDFLAVENEEQTGTKSGDAIIVNVPDASTGEQRLIVVDAGFSDTGQKVVDKISSWYGTDHVDLVISTHPDSDHINGLQTVLESLRVDELMMHLPWKHNLGAVELGNYERIEKLHATATSKGVSITEPFTGESRYGGAVRILGPSVSFYEEQLRLAIDEATTGTAAARLNRSFAHELSLAGARLLEKVLSVFPAETLTNTDDTGPRNQTSAITLINTGTARMLLTGDAGISALEAAAQQYEASVGSFSAHPLQVFQAPHHGSKHNLGPTVLDRVIGPKGAAHGPVTAFVSSAKAAEKHPSPKVTNALGRRGASVTTTEGKNVHMGDSDRPGYVSTTPVGPLVEDDDE